MTDYYTNRLGLHKKEREERYPSSLPMQKPTSGIPKDGSGIRTMAEKPSGQEAPPESNLMRDFNKYASQDEAFSSEMEAFQVKAEALKNQFAGMNVPSGFLEKKIAMMADAMLKKQAAFHAMPQQQEPMNFTQTPLGM